MACGLSRTELKIFNIALDDNQRCQAVLPGGGAICNSLLSEHVRDKKESSKGIDEVELDTSESSSCCGRFGKRFLHSAQVFIVTYMVILCFLTVIISGLNFEVGKSSVSNLMVDNDVDALRFWFRTNQIGMDIVEYSDYNEHDEQSYTYSTHGLSHYNCANDVDCEDAIDDLSAAWNALLLASSISAALTFVSWILGAPRNFYACLYNTKVYKKGLSEEKKIWLWFLKPIGLTYALTIVYAVVFGIQFIALFRYINRLPSNEEMYSLSLHYLNSDPTLCSSAAPCDYSYESAYGFSRNYAFLIVAVVFAALAVVFVAMSHTLKLQSIQWGCFGVFCGQQNASVPISTDDSTDASSMEQTRDEYSFSTAPPEAIVVTSLEVEGTKLTEVDLTSQC